jgi:hypothetical protein
LLLSLGPGGPGGRGEVGAPKGPKGGPSLPQEEVQEGTEEGAEEVGKKDGINQIMGALKTALGEPGWGPKGGPERFDKGPKEDRGWPGNDPLKSRGEPERRSQSGPWKYIETSV